MKRSAIHGLSTPLARGEGMMIVIALSISAVICLLYGIFLTPLDNCIPFCISFLIRIASYPCKPLMVAIVR